MNRLFLFSIPLFLGQAALAASLDCTTIPGNNQVLVSNVSLELDGNNNLIHFQLVGHQNPMSAPLLTSQVDQGALTIAEDVAAAVGVQLSVWFRGDKTYVSASRYMSMGIPQMLVCNANPQ